MTRCQGILVHNSDPSMDEAEAEGSLRAQGHPGLQSEILSKEMKIKNRYYPKDKGLLK